MTTYSFTHQKIKFDLVIMMQSLMSMQTNIPIKAIIMAIGMLITIITCSCKESDIEVDSFDASVFRGEVYDFLTINGIDTTLID